MTWHSTLTILAALLLPAEGGYTVAGEVTVPSTGAIHLFLVTEAQFGTVGTGHHLVISSAGDDASTQLAFSFEGIEPGTYGIRAYQDEDGDGELDGGLFGPSEPWGMSWKGGKPSGWPSFEDLSFAVEGDITNLTITLAD